MKGTIWCLHGAVGMADDWSGFSVPGWAIKRVDLWRFLDCCPMSMPAFGDALNEEAAATQGRKVLLGYSMGGRLALHALLQGSVWEAGVIVSAHPGLEDEPAKKDRRAKDAEWGARALRDDWSDFLEAWNGQAVLGTSAGGASFANRALLKQRRQAVARSFMDWTLGGQESLWDQLPNLPCPVLWAVGEQDEKFRSLGENALTAHHTGNPAPRASMDLWVGKGAGHRLPWDLPDEFAKKVGEFLEGVDS
ncbi:alpha/beta fold hydrolase [Haloferula rosea]|nr:alpha/beta fold hydrolase [Haloferula rosea]